MVTKYDPRIEWIGQSCFMQMIMVMSNHASKSVKEDQIWPILGWARACADTTRTQLKKKKKKTMRAIYDNIVNKHANRLNHNFILYSR